MTQINKIKTLRLWGGYGEWVFSDPAQKSEERPLGVKVGSNFKIKKDALAWAKANGFKVKQMVD